MRAKDRAHNYRKPEAAVVDPKPRRCLMCGDFFQSEGIHNRVCRKCHNTQLWQNGC